VAPNRKIAIFSVHEDLHAFAVKAEIESRSGTVCEVIETDQLCATGSFSWSNNGRVTGELRSAQNQFLSLDSFDMAWVRRIRLPQRVPPNVTGPSEVALINADCRAALYGILRVAFHGSLIDDPLATMHAENKLVQLEVARKAGIAVPDTLVSQNPARIRQFFDSHGGRVVAKVVQGTIEAPSFVGILSPDMLDMEDVLRLTPAIYQEYIPGTQHLRVHCFGDIVVAARIVSSDVDWRSKYDISVKPASLSSDLGQRVRQVVDDLGFADGGCRLEVGSGWCAVLAGVESTRTVPVR
jgi:hypothetical protein